MMREINIAEIIASKRKEKGITQDELAEYVGVTKASVSKWETAQSYPDITILPQLAAYFNISIDELIGYRPQMTKEDIRKTYHHLAAEFSRKPFEDVLDECHAVIKKYYSCFPLLLQMAVLLLNHYTLEENKEKQKAILKEIVDLCVRIKTENNDVWTAKQANSIEAACRLILNQPEEVFKLLDETTKPMMGDEIILASAYQTAGNGGKAKLVLQISLYQHLLGFFSAAQSYLSLIANQPEKFNETFERFIKLSEIFELEKLNPNLICQLYYAAAYGYMLQDSRDRALEMLENYTRICTTLLLPYQLKGDDFFDEIDEWLKEYVEAPRDEKIVKESILESVTGNPLFSPLHDEIRYKNIVDRLKSYVGGIYYGNDKK